MSDPFNWHTACRALARAWQPLVLYELTLSLVTSAVLGPLLAILSYRLIGLSGESFLGNWELARFFLSPIGFVALLLFVALSFGLSLVEYAGLILLADTALCGRAVSLADVAGRLLWALPRLLGLAVICTALAIAVAVPFLGLGALAYWLLLSGTDINYYLAQRPPRFWAAVTVATVLAGGFLLAALWFFARWAMAVPACVLERASVPATLGLSSRLMRGRVRRVLIALFAWQVLRYLAFVAALALLDLANRALMQNLEGRLTTLVWATGTMVVLDSLVLESLAALFAIALAGLLAYEYEQARRSRPELPRLAEVAQRNSAAVRRWPLRAIILGLACIGPLASLASTIYLARESIVYRPVMVTAHRAGPKSEPENSLAALRLSMDAGADYVEIDVQQTRDGQVVLMHDRDLRRLTGDPRDVSDVTMSDLAPLRLRAAERWTEERVPTLAQFLDQCGDRLRVNVELKDFGRSPELAAAAVGVLREQGFLERAVVSCLQLPPLVQARGLQPELPVGLIVSASQGDLTRLPVQFLSLNHRAVRADVVRRAHDQEMQVHAWSIADRETALRMLDLGCDNLITSDPVLIREIVDDYMSLGDVERMLLRLRRWMRE